MKPRSNQRDRRGRYRRPGGLRGPVLRPGAAWLNCGQAAGCSTVAVVAAVVLQDIWKEMTSKMQMTESEICMRYRRAADPRKQVRILAQLNACRVEEIAEILAAHGTGIVKPMPRGPVTNLTPEQCAELLRLHRDGVSLEEIGRLLGCSRRTAGRKIKALLAYQKKGGT